MHVQCNVVIRGLKAQSVRIYYKLSFSTFVLESYFWAPAIKPSPIYKIWGSIKNSC
jgi:hypothetical protein